MPRASRRILSFFLALLCLSGSMTCRALPPQIAAEAYILMDAGSGRILLAREETREKSIASTTKIMTALVALEHCRLSDMVTVKKEHLKEGSSMYLAEGEQLTMEQLLYGLMLPSGNDAAECIADYCGNGKARFVAWMNEKAAELGLTHTSFANPSGLDEKNHHSCALDMAKLAAYAMENPAFLRIVSTRSAAAGTRTMSNHNKLLGSIPGCIGLKTGYTGDAGRTLVSCAQRNGLRLVAVTLHSGSDWDDHAALYDYGFSTYRSETAVKSGESYAYAPVRGGVRSSVDAVAAQSFSYPVCEGEILSTEVLLSEPVTAPVRRGQTLGELKILLGGQEVGRVALVSGENVDVPEKEEETLAARLRRLFSR